MVAHGPVLPRATLRPREREILNARFRGLTYEEVGARFGIGHETVRNHIGNAYRALGVSSLIDAARVLGYLRLPGEEDTATADRIRLLPSIEPSPYGFPDLVEREDVLAIVEGRG